MSKLRLLIVILCLVAVLRTHCLAQPYGFSALRLINTDAVSDSVSDGGSAVYMNPQGEWLWASIRDSKDLRVFRTEDYGINWSVSPVLDSPARGISMVGDSKGRVLLVYSSRDSLNGEIGTDYDILCRISDDNGITWTSPIVVNSNAKIDFENDSDNILKVQTDGNGKWVVLWAFHDFSSHEAISTYYVSRSVDNGLTWSTRESVISGYVNGTDFKMDKSGNCVFLVIQSIPLPRSNIFYLTSVDYGVTWSASKPVRGASSPDILEILDGSVATDNNGHWVMVWPSVNTSPGYIYGNDSDIWSASMDNLAQGWVNLHPVDPNAAHDTSYEDIPFIDTDSLGNWLVIWRSQLTGSADFHPFVTRSSDYGQTWDNIRALIPPAASIHNKEAGIVSNDRNGKWAIFISAVNEAGGPYGTDSDLFITTSTNLDQTNSARTWVDYSNLLSSPVTRPTRMLADLGRFGRGY